MRIHVKERPFHCDFAGCDQSFMTTTLLGAHKKQRHLGLYEVFCEICGVKFFNRESYEVHVRSKHTGIRPFACTVSGCGKAFFSVNSLRAHKNNVHGDPITCPISNCGKILSSSQCLRIHLNYHNVRYFFHHQQFLHSYLIPKFQNAQKYICHFENCGKRCISNYVLQNHLKSKHLGLAEYSCKECSAVYFKKCSLEKHIR